MLSVFNLTLDSGLNLNGLTCLLNLNLHNSNKALDIS